MSARRYLLALCLAAVALAATAQSTVPRLRTVEPAPAPAAAADLAVVDKDAQIARLRENNARLRAENNALKARIEQMTTPGGSLVRAYCASDTESRTTAGASDACGVYTCNQTSGLCRDRCSSSFHCSSGTRCNEGTGRCEFPPGG